MFLQVVDILWGVMVPILIMVHINEEYRDGNGEFFFNVYATCDAERSAVQGIDRGIDEGLD